jgi:cytochrome c peroxidase
MFVLGLVAGICFVGGRRAMAQKTPNFGPNVFIFDPSISNSAIQSKLTSHALRKGQAKLWMLSAGIRGEVRLVERAFGLGPSIMTEAMLQLQAAFA